MSHLGPCSPRFCKSRQIRPTLTQFLHFLNLGIHAIPPLFVIPPYKAFMRSRGQLKYADVAGLGGSSSGSHYESVTPGLDLTIDPYSVNYPAGLHDLPIKSFGNPLHIPRLFYTPDPPPPRRGHYVVRATYKTLVQAVDLFIAVALNNQEIGETCRCRCLKKKLRLESHCLRDLLRVDQSQSPRRHQNQIRRYHS